jgi:hypothetical protein
MNAMLNHAMFAAEHQRAERDAYSVTMLARQELITAPNADGAGYEPDEQPQRC